MKTKRNYQISKQALILASISLVAAAMIVPAITGGEEPVAQGIENKVQTESILQIGSSKTVIIMGHEETKFVPQVIRIGVGDGVVFINQDGYQGGLPHTVVSVDSDGVPTGEFESELLYVGDAFEVSFDEPGIYRYVDSIYPEMVGTIVVI